MQVCQPLRSGTVTYWYRNEQKQNLIKKSAAVQKDTVPKHLSHKQISSPYIQYQEHA